MRVVQCIDDDNSGNRLVKLTTYNVKKIDAGEYVLENVTGSWSPRRFVTVINNLSSRWVKCIDVTSGGNYINKNQVFEVDFESKDQYILKGSGGGLAWNQSRFEKLGNDDIYLKCVDLAGVSKYLVKDKVYRLIAVDQSSYKIEGVDELWHYSRFQIETNTTQNTIQKKSGPADISDWKVWRDSSLLPGHCVCQIPKSMCSYHKA